MTITSVYYLILVVAGAFVYYIVPKRVQWVILLIMSLVFYWFTGTPYTFAYIVFNAAAMHIISNLIFKTQAVAANTGRKARIFLITGIVLCILPWFLTAAYGLWLPVLTGVSQIIPLMTSPKKLPLLPALGMGYYTCMSISYLTDCFWGNAAPRKNPLKTLLYISFFPQLTTGPISRNEHMESLFKGHTISYKNVSFGAQRMLWGFMKKLILAERLAVIVNTIWGDLTAYGGIWHWVAALVYPIYLYADFSGCIDIVLGTAEIFGIRLPENFNNPFFSRNIGEFWRRWHITLGNFAKDYVMYPLLKSAVFIKWGKTLKSRIGKRASKFIVSAVASAAVWLVMGAWHGAAKHIIGVSLYFWLMLELGEFVSLYSGIITSKLHIKTESFGWHLFQSTRTYVIYAVGAPFFVAAGTKEALLFVGSLFTGIGSNRGYPVTSFEVWKTAIGITPKDLTLIIFMIILLFAAAILRENYGYARNFIASRSIVARWVIWITFFFILIIFGKYGENYNAAAFIYQGF